MYSAALTLLKYDGDKVYSAIEGKVSACASFPSQGLIQYALRFPRWGKIANGTEMEMLELSILKLYYFKLFT